MGFAVQYIMFYELTSTDIQNDFDDLEDLANWGIGTWGRVLGLAASGDSCVPGYAAIDWVA